MSQVFTEHAIRDGVTLLHHQSSKWKTDLVKVLFVAPLDEATPSRSLGAYLLRHGPQRLGGMSGLAKALKDLYGASLTAVAGRSVTHQVITLRAKTVSRRFCPRKPDTLRRVLDLLDETMRKPHFMASGFDQQSYELEQMNLIRAIASQDDRPGSYADRRLVEMMFGDHPLSHRIHGTPEQVAELQADHVASSVRDVFSNAPCFVYAITDREGEAVAELVRDRLSLGARSTFRRSGFQVPVIRKRSQSMREVRPLAQSRLAMGFRLDGYSRRRDRFTAYMGDFLLGGGSSSRLFRIVREKHSLAYSIGSTFEDVSGTLQVSAGIEPTSESRVRKMVSTQVNYMARHSADPKMMALGHLRFQQSLQAFKDSQDQLVGFDSAQRLKGQRVRTPEQVMASHRRVTPERVAEAFSRLKLDSVFILGPDGEAR